MQSHLVGSYRSFLVLPLFRDLLNPTFLTGRSRPDLVGLADDESDLLTEVSEYVVTKEVSKRLDELLSTYFTGGAANGVWIAGFFGSGKSHLLKILSLLLENRRLATHESRDLFLPKLIEDPLLKADLEKAIKIPSRSIRFNIDQKADLIAKDQVDSLLAVFVKVFNELRGFYPKQGYIARRG